MSKRRTVALIVRVTPEEKSAVTVAAERSDQTLSEWLRRAVVAKLKATQRELAAEDEERAFLESQRSLAELDAPPPAAEEHSQ